MRSLWYFLVSLSFAHGLPDLNIGGVDLPDIVANAVNGAESIFGNVAGNAADSALEKLADELMAQLNAINQSPSKDAAAGCLQTEVEIGGECVAKKNLGQSCPKGVKQCPSGAICSRLCVCPSGFLGSGPTLCVKCNPSTQVLVDGKCYSMATFNAACVV
uniref:EB domain-containing protein n=1 Tax=Plectus sambesii TaxID=2011161 RepID=A0A914WCY7_9BILA